MKLKYCLILLLSIIVFTKVSNAQTTDNNNENINQIKRPKIGLVLSGGGAKGLAHIGALRAIEKAGIKVD